VSTILCVDDDQQILRALIANLRARGYDVTPASSGEEALRLASDHQPDAVILDLGLPGMSGIDVIHGLRGWTTVPILVLSARDGECDKIAALDAGADDYISKPFGMGELLARLRAALRRSDSVSDGSEEEASIVTEHFTIDLSAKRVLDAEGEIRLTPTEWGIVEMLVRNAGKLVTGRQLLQHVWGPAYGEETNYLRVHMAHIRRKLEPVPGNAQYFITEAGIGYRFEPTTTR
jgi:two-component system, OmpR family, KDP operon response regulator KdpE